jgi:hypothetical protein
LKHIGVAKLHCMKNISRVGIVKLSTSKVSWIMVKFDGKRFVAWKIKINMVLKGEGVHGVVIENYKKLVGN